MIGFPGNLQDLLEQAQKLQQELMSARDEAVKKEFEASAGGGMVTVRLNGTPEILSVRIDPTVVSAEDVSMLQDLVQAAINQGLRMVREQTESDLTKLAPEIPLGAFGPK